MDKGSLERAGMVLQDARFIESKELGAKMRCKLETESFLDSPRRLFERDNFHRASSELFYKGDSIKLSNAPKPITFQGIHILLPIKTKAL
jgi:hypothetical protein